MSKILINIIIAGMITLLGVPAIAQKGVEDGSRYGHGEDSIRCLKNLSLFTEYVKQKSFADAIPSWEIVYNECPLSSSRIYTDGIKIMDWRIKNEKDKAKKDELFEKLMGIYDQRIKYMGNHRRYNEGYILGRKATKMLSYKGDDPVFRKKAQELYEKSIAAQGVKSEVFVLATFMSNTVDMYRKNEADAEVVVKNFVKVSDLLTDIIKAEKKESNKERTKGVKDTVEKLFASSGAADCQTIEKIFSPNLVENKTNLDWLKMVNKLLARANCEDAQLLYDVSENLHVIEPSSSSAYGLARMYLKTQDLEKAVEYYNQAINLEEEDEQKGTFYYQLGLIKFNQGRLAEARSNAQKAINLRPSWGDPYILIGNLYATSAKNFGSNEFEHKTAYWVAVDMFKKAKSIDPEKTEKANELINIYTQHFPGMEEIFFQGFKEGDTYSVGGWIGASTKVRAKK
ncbi:Tetratricopeptide repeat-containing protein [Saccharicrinis carchari]|uniref:Tetratricopeptide repeat-containing protein n=1 Tax=Saccharicrinis carchari TaxID=1168039 RepID=A0A521D4P9_SACCC|nr:tetratricopeptide repeat protein [Saccharicrinis carchari]SMO66645.1 Tetratricopeptide repeat-containing protein [Saccharicrinis carchari]